MGTGGHLCGALSPLVARMLLLLLLVCRFLQAGKLYFKFSILGSLFVPPPWAAAVSFGFCASLGHRFRLGSARLG
jgi:hypothetical protein